MTPYLGEMSLFCVAVSLNFNRPSCARRSHIQSFGQLPLFVVQRMQLGWDVVWEPFKLPGRGLLPRHWRWSKKTALGWHSYASRQSDAHQLGRQSLQCSWTSSLELSADGTISRLVITGVLDSSWKRFYLVSGTKAQCESYVNCSLEIFLLT